jgi:hypothetical protein
MVTYSQALIQVLSNLVRLQLDPLTGTITDILSLEVLVNIVCLYIYMFFAKIKDSNTKKKERIKNEPD